MHALLGLVRLAPAWPGRLRSRLAHVACWPPPAPRRRFAAPAGRWRYAPVPERRTPARVPPRAARSAAHQAPREPALLLLRSYVAWNARLLLATGARSICTETKQERAHKNVPDFKSNFLPQISTNQDEISAIDARPQDLSDPAKISRKDEIFAANLKKIRTNMIWGKLKIQNDFARDLRPD